MLEAQPDTPATQSVRGYVLPTQISRYVECNTFDERSPHPRMRVETLSCSMPSRDIAQPGVYVAGLSMQHRILQSAGLQPLQFERQVDRLAAVAAPIGRIGQRGGDSPAATRWFRWTDSMRGSRPACASTGCSPAFTIST